MAWTWVQQCPLRHRPFQRLQLGLPDLPAATMQLRQHMQHMESLLRLHRLLRNPQRYDALSSLRTLA